MIKPILGALLAFIMAGGAFAQSSSLNGPATNVATPVVASSLSVPGQNILLGVHVTAPSAGFVMLFDAAAAPSDGTVTPSGCFTLPAPASPGTSGTLSMANAPLAPKTANGITVVFSTTGCFTKTASTTAYISVLYQ